MKGVKRNIFIVNPLPTTLRHYERALAGHLKFAGIEVSVVPERAADVSPGYRKKIEITISVLTRRLKMARLQHEHVLVIWPLYGYFDIATWMFLLWRQNTVYIVFHDPEKIRRQFGYGPVAVSLFRRIAKHRGFVAITHSRTASDVLTSKTGIESRVVHHPFLHKSDARPSRSPLDGERPIVRVLGQYKPSRNLDSLAEIARRFDGLARLEIYGRGWPEVPGWCVISKFIPEGDFDSYIKSADVVVIPYSNFFQSGVAVRCLENIRPVVAPNHEHICQLYGTNWPGLVQKNNWSGAVALALAVRTEQLVDLRSRMILETNIDWQNLLPIAI